jgi:hypothetical protein
MHDIDRSFMETESETFEFSGEGEDEYETSYEGESYEDEALGEGEVEQLAAELLSINSEDELDHFLGSLIKKVGRAAGKLVKSPIGQQLTGALKNIASKALPLAGSALGNMVVPGLGGVIGGNLASKAGSLFGLELEGLSNEDQQFEVAKQFVRLAADASKSAVSAPASQPAVQAVKEGLTQAAQKFAPGMLQGASHASGAQSGRWVRRGNKIVIYGV